MTQKEYHQAWAFLHDPKDPNKYPFCGPRFITDKNLRETVQQYNIEHPEHSLTEPSKSLQTPPSIL